MAPVPAESSMLWNLIKLVVVLGLAGGFLYAINLMIKSMQAAVEQAKGTLANKGVNITKDGVAVKTDKRAPTQEETADKIQAGLMKGWKSSTFNVPSALSYGTNLSGSSHDKNKADYEAKYGPKKSKKAE